MFQILNNDRSKHNCMNCRKICWAKTHSSEVLVKIPCLLWTIKLTKSNISLLFYCEIQLPLCSASAINYSTTTTTTLWALHMDNHTTIILSYLYCCKKSLFLFVFWVTWKTMYLTADSAIVCKFNKFFPFYLIKSMKSFWSL